jgi:hypothetical protein
MMSSNSGSTAFTPQNPIFHTTPPRLVLVVHYFYGIIGALPLAASRNFSLFINSNTFSEVLSDFFLPKCA